MGQYGNKSQNVVVSSGWASWLTQKLGQNNLLYFGLYRDDMKRYSSRFDPHLNRNLFT